MQQRGLTDSGSPASGRSEQPLHQNGGRYRACPHFQTRRVGRQECPGACRSGDGGRSGESARKVPQTSVRVGEDNGTGDGGANGEGNGKDGAASREMARVIRNDGRWEISRIPKRTVCRPVNQDSADLTRQDGDEVVAAVGIDGSSRTIDRSTYPPSISLGPNHGRGSIAGCATESYRATTVIVAVLKTLSVMSRVEGASCVACHLAITGVVEAPAIARSATSRRHAQVNDTE